MNRYRNIYWKSIQLAFAHETTENKNLTKKNYRDCNISDVCVSDNFGREVNIYFFILRGLLYLRKNEIRRHTDNRKYST